MDSITIVSDPAQGTMEHDKALCQRLYKAVFHGYWATAKNILEHHPHALTLSLNSLGDTFLHIAAIMGHEMITEELVRLLSMEGLQKMDEEGDTALSKTARGENIKIAKIMVEKNNNLLRITNGRHFIPVVEACSYGNKEMMYYLYSVTPMEELSPGKHGATLLTFFITANMLDMALDLLKRYPKLVITPDNYGETALTRLAKKPSSFPSGTHDPIWQPWTWLFHLYPFPGIKQLHERKLMSTQTVELLEFICSEISVMDEPEILKSGVHTAAFVAVKYGIVEIVAELVKSFPQWLRYEDRNGRGICQNAIVHRQEKIFNHVYGLHKNVYTVGFDDYGNNILHLAGKLSPPSKLQKVSGAAFEMQRDLQWFQAVERIVLPVYKEMLNGDGRTPYEVFTEEHRGLVKEGEKWMKDTSSSCMVVATLIATVMFAAAFTVPGGNNSDTGNAIFLRKDSFMVFIVADAISLFSSTTSVLMFLSIFTSRFEQQDFLKSLPRKLVLGLFTLFLAIATMMVAFGAALTIILNNRYNWVFIPIILVASVPVILFALLEFPLLLDMAISTFRPQILK